MYRLRVTSAAHRDVVEIAKYFVGISPHLGRRFLKAIDLSCHRLRLAPDLGELLSVTESDATGYRCWCVRGFEHYVIFYRISMETIEIVRVAHSAQDMTSRLTE